MKHTKLITLLALTISSAWSQEPDRLRSLRDSYRSAVERSTAPLTKTYLTELEKLKTELTKKGDLQGALAVESEIKVISPTAQAPAPNDDDIAKSIEGTDWRNKNKAAKDGIRFEGGKVFFVDQSGGRRGYVFTNEGQRTLGFNYGSGQKVLITFDRQLKTFELSAPKSSFERVSPK
ncbi:MAG: hypothetical protein JNM99_07060 [Verrucomicrobiaceae bacterium]|nr:hypothetical protein [Verrucomicrobiaceae bacterium]